MIKRTLCAIFAALSLIACGATSVTMTGPTVPPRGDHCKFRVLTTTPAAPFDEIGVIDVQPGAYGADVYRDLSEFKEHIEPYVCQAGGDAAIALANGYGMYIKATIIKVHGASPSRTVPPPPLPASSLGGCQYDTQCKGERVCRDGECADP